MHELPITKSILDVVVKHAALNRVEKVVSITLNIGVLSDLEPEFIQKYFDWISKGTVADGAILKMNKSPLILLCSACSWSYEQDISSGSFTCPECGASEGFRIVSGKGYYIQDMEVM
ncbi:hydrogenase maturation nickel metallochaperone HypA [Desulforegula conservatrix]|uniref:hydrogenase maturation nickel metallochaperone HypA n=1 Tax=Desulforegula conservatrix TaxID=153026 RepID=UPI00040A6699|nr:hydrogenase maturation nickel metallochaperone HypA [Desulforegula conservatrix]